MRTDTVSVPVSLAVVRTDTVSVPVSLAVVPNQMQSVAMIGGNQMQAAAMTGGNERQVVARIGGATQQVNGHSLVWAGNIMYVPVMLRPRHIVAASVGFVVVPHKEGT